MQKALNNNGYSRFLRTAPAKKFRANPSDGVNLRSLNKETFLRNDLLQHAVMMAIIAIGECANQLSEEFKEEHSEIEWVQIVAVRNIAAHGYWQLDMEQIWQAIIEDIPKLQKFVEKLG